MRVHVSHEIWFKLQVKSNTEFKQCDLVFYCSLMSTELKNDTWNRFSTVLQYLYFNRCARIVSARCFVHHKILEKYSKTINLISQNAWIDEKVVPASNQ